MTPRGDAARRVTTALTPMPLSVVRQPHGGEAKGKGKPRKSQRRPRGAGGQGGGGAKQDVEALAAAAMVTALKELAEDCEGDEAERVLEAMRKVEAKEAAKRASSSTLEMAMGWPVEAT